MPGRIDVEQRRDGGSQVDGSDWGETGSGDDAATPREEDGAHVRVLRVVAVQAGAPAGQPRGGDHRPPGAAEVAQAAGGRRREHQVAGPRREGEAQRGGQGVAPMDLEREVAAGALLVDIRPIEQRDRDGELPGALVIDRNVLEWRLAPSSNAKVVDIAENEKVIVVCNQGFQSTLAAANLRELGVDGATDLIGGYEAWNAGPADE